MRQHVPPKRRYASIRLNSVTSQKTALLTILSVSCHVNFLICTGQEPIRTLRIPRDAMNPHCQHTLQAGKLSRSFEWVTLTN